MAAGLPKYIVVNLKTLGEKFNEGEEVSLDTLSQKRVLNLSGREAKLPLKVNRQFLHWQGNLTILHESVSIACKSCKLAPALQSCHYS